MGSDYENGHCSDYDADLGDSVFDIQKETPWIEKKNML